MRRFAVPAVITTLVVAFLIVLAIGIAGNGTNDSLDSAVASHHYLPAPDAGARLQLLGSHGTESLSKLRGHVVLVNVFASWCEPCQTEAPAIERAQHLLAAHGGTVLGVSYQDNASADTSFVHQYGWSFPVVQDPSGDFAHAFGVTGVPENFVVNAQGKVTALFRGPVSSSWIQQALHRALAQPA